jgi:glucuronate isomerase
VLGGIFSKYIMQQSFITDDFLLHNNTAKKLHHDFAKMQPIYAYHSHLSPKDIAEDRQFKNITQLWIEGDHYKWRAIRVNGRDENILPGTLLLLRSLKNTPKHRHKH